MTALRDSDDLVVAKAAYALGHLGAVEAIAQLVRLLEHSTPEVQSAAVTALERVGPSAASQLVIGLTHELDQVREHAANALGTFADRDSVPALLRALQDRAWRVRVAAIVALNRIAGDDVTSAIARACEDDDSRVRTLAVRILKRR
jgi:HEAT repeat protein